MSAAEEELAAELAHDHRLLTPRFVVVVAASLAYFVGVGVLAPVLPRYVERQLGGGGTEVGVAVGAFALAALLLRPFVGRAGDRRGRRPLVVVGCAIAAASIFGYGLVHALAWLVVARLVTGAGEAGVFVGAATAAQDLAPQGRRGQAASMFSVAIYGGLSLGPVLGEWAYHRSPGTGWVVAGGCCALGSVLGLFLPPRPEVPSAGSASEHGHGGGGGHKLLHPAAVRPGLVLMLSTTGFAGFQAFVPLYVDRTKVGSAGTVFLIYGVLVLAIRIVASRLPDVLGTWRGPLLALAFQAVGLAVLGAVQSKTGLYGGTAIFGLGASLLYPSAFPLVVDRAPDEERSHAIGTFTLFFDLATGLGAPILGVVVALTNERGAFLGAAALNAAAFGLHTVLNPPSSAHQVLSERAAA